MENKFNYYNKSLQPFAVELRHRMTKAEACLWKYALSRKQMCGYTFNRQRPVLNYIADFMCKELKLIIEVDGITHQWEETLVKDAAKDRSLKQAGFTILRFKDEDVLKDIALVKKVISETIEELESKTSPNPLSEGEKYKQKHEKT
jgi:very-short-patch-repair endonuclease